jgi:hypothetical protein
MKGMGCGSVSCPPRGPRRAGATGFRRTRRDWSERFPNWLTEQPVNTAGQPVNRKKQLFVHFKIKINTKITKSYNFKSNSFCPAQTFIHFCLPCVSLDDPHPRQQVQRTFRMTCLRSSSVRSAVSTYVFASRSQRMLVVGRLVSLSVS